MSVDPVTATLPVLPGNVQSGEPPLCGAAVGHELAAVAVPDTTSVGTTAAMQAASTAEEYNRKDFTAIRYNRSIRPLSTRTTNRGICRIVRVQGIKADLKRAPITRLEPFAVGMFRTGVR